MGRTILVFGLMLAAFGIVVLLAEKYPWFKFGQLPGDLVFQKGRTRISVPVTSMLVLSALMSAGFYLLRFFKR